MFRRELLKLNNYGIIILPLEGSHYCNDRKNCEGCGVAWDVSCTSGGGVD